MYFFPSAQFVLVGHKHVMYNVLECFLIIIVKFVYM